MAKITMVHTDIETLTPPSSGTSLFILDELSGKTVAKLLHPSGLVTILGIESNTGTTDLSGLYHTNRTDLDLVSGTNTGDQDLTPYWTSGQTEEYLLNYYTTGDTTTLLQSYQLMSDRGIADGYVPLNSDGLIDSIYISDFNAMELTGLTIFTDLIYGYSVTGGSVSFGDENISIQALSGDLNTDYKISTLTLSKNDISLQYSDQDSTSPTYGQGLKFEKENFGWKIATTDSVIPTGLTNVVIVGTTGITASKSNTTYLGDINVNGQDINFSDYVTSGGYYTSGQTDALLSQYSLTSHTHSQYLTGDTFWQYEQSSIDYGYLYSGYIVGSLGYCISGYRVPSNTDWNTLITNLGASTGNILKSSREVPTSHPRWNDGSSTPLTDSLLYSLFPGGNRKDDGTFQLLGEDAFLWSSTAVDMGTFYAYTVNYLTDTLSQTSLSRNYGASVRLMRDATMGEYYAGHSDGDIIEYVTDLDGNSYTAIYISGQVWLNKNLKTNKYTYMGTQTISEVTGNTEWSTNYSGVYCKYDNQPLSYYAGSIDIVNQIKPYSGVTIDASYIANIPEVNIGNTDLTLSGNRILTINDNTFYIKSNTSGFRVGLGVEPGSTNFKKNITLKSTYVYGEFETSDDILSVGNKFTFGANNTGSTTSTIIGADNGISWSNAGPEVVIGFNNTISWNSDDFIIGTYNTLEGQVDNEGGQNYILGSSNTLTDLCQENYILGMMNTVNTGGTSWIIGNYNTLSNTTGHFIIGNSITIPDAEVSTSTLYTNNIATIGEIGDGNGIVRLGFENTQDSFRFRKDGSTLYLEGYNLGSWVTKDSWTI